MGLGPIWIMKIEKYVNTRRIHMDAPGPINICKCTLHKMGCNGTGNQANTHHQHKRGVACCRLCTICDAGMGWRVCRDNCLQKLSKVVFENAG